MSTRHLCVGSLALNDTVYADGRTSMADAGGNALYAAVGANIWSNQVGIVAVVGYDWPADYTQTLEQSAIDTSGLTHTDEETLRAWTIYELSGYRRYFSRNTEVVLLTPSPFSSNPLTPEEAAAYGETARQVHIRNSPLPQELPDHLWQVDTIHISPMRLETTLTWINYLQDKPDIFFLSIFYLIPSTAIWMIQPCLNSLAEPMLSYPAKLKPKVSCPVTRPKSFAKQLLPEGLKLW